MSSGAGERADAFWEMPEPWQHPVDVADILTELETRYGRYLALEPHAAVVLALWTVFTYVIDAFPIAPMLCLASPEKRCGKTTTLKLLDSQVNRPMSASNVTAAAIYRCIEMFRPTLLIDEADTFLSENEALRGVLNSGHSRSTAYVMRTVGEKHEPKRFSTWCPKTIAMISLPPSTIVDRSIVLKMRRKVAGDSVVRLREDRLPAEVLDLRRKCVRWAEDLGSALADADPPMPADLNDRAQDNWRPLLAIAELAGQEWLTKAADAATAFNSEADESELSEPLLLLADIREYFATEAVDRVSSADLLSYLHQLEERPWLSYRYGRALTQRQLAHILRPFGVHSASVRIHGRPTTVKGYHRDWFNDPFGRYLPAEHPEHAEGTQTT